MHQPEILRRGVMMNALNREHIKHILCLHCERNMGLDGEGKGEGVRIALVRCGRDRCWTYRYLRTRCPEYKADCSKQPEPCNGDCEKCRTRTEWKEWSE